MPAELARQYKSRAQQTRVVSEAWGERNLYCPACVSPRLRSTPPGTEVVDYICPRCSSEFQLKSQSHPHASRIVDAAYDKMVQAVLHGRAPNIFALHYSLANWAVVNLLLVPRYAFSLSCIQRRKPLGPTARRRGWVGCNIVVGGIPPDARIPLVLNGVACAEASVRRQYGALRRLEGARHEARGWTLDVLNVVRGLGRKEFSLAEVYAHAEALARLHPRNKNIEPKIRQQLQILRDMGLVEFLAPGRYGA